MTSLRSVSQSGPRPTDLRATGDATTSSSRTTLPCDSHSASLARQVVQDVLSGAGLADLQETALLLVSELVTNAYLHTGTDLELSVTTTAEVLTVEVVDHSAVSLPQAVVVPPADSEGGRGLLLLDLLASAWGTRHFASSKGVWFRLGSAVPAPTATAAAAAPTAPAPSPARRRLAESGTRRLDIGWLTRLPTGLEQQLTSGQVIGELLERLVAALDLRQAWLFGTSSQDERWQLLSMPGRPATALSADLVQQVAQADTPSRVLPLAAGMQLLPLVGRTGTDAALVLAGRTDLSVDELAIARLVGDRAAGLSREESAWARSMRSRSSLTLLAQASELFAGSLDVMHALVLTTQLVVPRFATWSALSLLPKQGPEPLAVAHTDESRLPGLRDALSGPAAAAAIARLSGRIHDRPRLVPDAELPAGLTRVQPEAVLAVPLVARRRQLAVLLIGGPAGSGWSPDDVELLGDLARRAALAIDNARLYEASASIAKELQALLLPPALPCAPGVEFGARYTPAGSGSDVGGDFYDVFALADQGWGVVIGDVCGKGAGAAAITGTARDVLKLLLQDGAAPPSALRRLNTSILELGDRGRLCTAIAATVRPAGQGVTVRLSSAGHPPPVLLRSDGQVDLFGHYGTLLGVLADIDVADDELHLGPGDALVFYTDGVTESRRGREMFAEDGLQNCLRGSAGLSADAIAGRLEDAVRTYAGGESRDDLAVLVISCPAAPSRGGPV